SDTPDLRRNLDEHFRPFGSHRQLQVSEAGNVATWVRDVFNQTTAIRVADDAEDNRNCACLIFQRLPGVKGVGDKNIRVPVDEFFRGGAQFIRVTRRPPAIINLNILAFRPTSLLETSSEGRDECWRGQCRFRDAHQYADPAY